MTDKPTITQADRDAAIDLAEALDFSATVAWLKTETDKPHLFSEAFANHRESAVAELQAEVERLREALKTISMMHDGNPSDIMADMPIADYRAVVIGEMKKEARATLAQKELKI